MWLRVSNFVICRVESQTECDKSNNGSTTTAFNDPSFLSFLQISSYDASSPVCFVFPLTQLFIMSNSAASKTDILWLFCLHVCMDFLSLHVYCNSYARKRRRRITIFPTTMDPAAEIRRQRDNIRHEMEQLVRTMQRLEPDVDNKRPGWEAKRDELAVHRQRLSELRGKMRQVMDAAANAGHSTPGASSMTPRQPQVLFPSHSTSASRVSPNRRSASPLRDRDPSPSHISSTGTAAHQLQDLAAIHRDEKRRLAEEVARLNDAMDRRHTQERAELEHRLQQEEKHLREYEMARQRMEEAQRQLEALKRPANVGGVSTRGGGGAIPELEALIRR